MILKEALMQEHSRIQALRIRDWIGNDTGRFAQLMDAFLNGHMRLNQRAAWVLGLVVKLEPELIAPYHSQLLQKLEKPMHNAVIRNTVRIWQWVPLPEEYAGAIANYCFQYLHNPKQAIAIRAFSMGVLFKMGLEWPEIMEELRAQLQQLLVKEPSAAMKNRGNKILNGSYKPER